MNWFMRILSAKVVIKILGNCKIIITWQTDSISAKCCQSVLWER